MKNLKYCLERFSNLKVLPAADQFCTDVLYFKNHIINADLNKIKTDILIPLPLGFPNLTRNIGTGTYTVYFYTDGDLSHRYGSPIRLTKRTNRKIILGETKKERLEWTVWLQAWNPWRDDVLTLVMTILNRFRKTE